MPLTEVLLSKKCAKEDFSKYCGQKLCGRSMCKHAWKHIDIHVII